MSNSTPSNGDWLRHLDKKFEDHQKWLLEHITDRLDTKADKDDLNDLEDRVKTVESKTNKLAVKQAGIAGVMTILLGYFKYLVTGQWM